MYKIKFKSSLIVYPDGLKSVSVKRGDTLELPEKLAIGLVRDDLAVWAQQPPALPEEHVVNLVPSNPKPDEEKKDDKK